MVHLEVHAGISTATCQPISSTPGLCPEVTRIYGILLQGQGFQRSGIGGTAEHAWLEKRPREPTATDGYADQRGLCRSRPGMARARLGLVGAATSESRP